MGVKFANNGHSTLAASITSSDTSITVASGHGARFPSLGAGDYFYATLIDASNNLEIVKCTARSSDVLTVTRGQESTTARAYAIADRIELRVTAQGITDATDIDTALPSQTSNSGKYLTTDGTNSSWGTVTPYSLPSQTGNSGKYLTTNGTSESWGTVSQKVLQVATNTTTGSTFTNQTFSWNSTVNSVGATHLSITFTPVSSTSTLLIYTNALIAISGNDRCYSAIRHNGTIVAWQGSNGYAADTGGGGMSAVVASGSTSARTIDLRIIGSTSGNGMTMGRAQGDGSSNRLYPELSSMHIIEVEV